MTAPVPPGLCSALVGRDGVGGGGVVGKGGVSRWRQSTFPSTPLGVESATLGAGDRSRGDVPSASPDTSANWRENKGFPVLHASFSQQNE